MQIIDRYCYRVWSKEDREMIYLQSSTDGFGLLTGDYTYDLLLGGEGEEHSQGMQCLGIQDKEGFGIYEGDLVMVEQWDFDTGELREPRLAEVVWSEDRLGFEFRGKDYLGDDDNFVSFSEENEYRIVGNIYEDPKYMKELGYPQSVTV